MDKFLIVTNDGKDKDGKVTGEVLSLLKKNGKKGILCPKDAEKKILLKEIPEDVECALVIGGDGSLIEVARLLRGRGIPILGINMGTLGYLTEVEPGSLEAAMTQVVRGEFDIENRMMLYGETGENRWDVALNDIVLTRNGGPRIIRFDLYVNGELLNEYEADGVIISTPTGSTAYNLSAGGPIVEPTASLILVTPICCHALYARSIILSAEDEIMIEIGKGRRGTKEEALVSFDGIESMAVKTGDKISVRRAKEATRILQLNRVSFLETLRRKMRGN